MISKKDLLIISSLRTDARMSLTKMSKKTQIPVSTIFDRLKTNENNYIKKHTSLLDFNSLGYNTRANIMFSVDSGDKTTLREFLVKHQNVNSCFRVNNGFDFMVEAIFENIQELESFVDKVEAKFKIKDKKSFFIIEDLKREEFMINPHLYS